jgi:hypothetical protein
MIPAINHAPRQARLRAGLTAAVADLLRSRVADADLISTPVFIPTKRTLEGELRDGDALPTAIATPIAGATAALLARTAPAPTATLDMEPVPVAAGSLGSWSDDD